jgi:hypothetical protein
VVILRAGQGDLLNLLALRKREGDRPPAALKLWITARTRSSDVNATLAIWGTSIPWAESNTICARRHVTTDPEDRRTIRNSRFPSSLVISRTRTRSATDTSSETIIASLRSSRPLGRFLPN